jgi:S-adenosylmethionine:tRNA-ribosyltransferase-isomerase (queuine synthetase)
MLRTDFHFDLPDELIAQRPTARRSASRMLFLDGAAGSHRDLQFGDLPSLLNPGDLLVFNDTRVIPARVMAAKESGGRVEILLMRLYTSRAPDLNTTHRVFSRRLEIAQKVMGRCQSAVGRYHLCRVVLNLRQ